MLMNVTTAIAAIFYLLLFLMMIHDDSLFLET